MIFNFLTLSERSSEATVYESGHISCSVGSVKQLVISLYYKRAKKNRNEKQKRVQRLKVDIKLVEV